MPQEYSEQIKAQALAALVAGETAASVARMFNVPIGTLRSWKSRQTNGDGIAMIATEKRERIGTLLLEYLETTLETLKLQQVVFRDQTWLKAQSAGEIAVLHGTLTDKTIRLLEGLADQGDESEGTA